MCKRCHSLPFRKDITAGRMTPDTDYSHRALVACTDGKHDFRILVPGTQFVAPESKTEFVRLLNAELTAMRERGLTLSLVTVTVGGKSGWEFVP